ncbi:hypothetical protein O8H85_002903 [Escherichia coli O157]|uniref:Hc1 head closure protein n=1 Tax=Escherichia phage vB_EcoM_SophiaRose TaxID=2836106 RepID=A0AAE7S5D7_9CAUD|nr:hypothetical protein [Escherichia coli]EKH6153912.1 hypothetical protein [Escherichia coli O157]EKH6169125.1 hypothetical protein [Escherichia coli O157]QXN68835.1 hypothetical protein SOPHIAROSE_54 [Escherichia phage vB_EcoM_SophiaRose]
MAAGYKLIGKNRLIPRKTFKGRHRVYNKTVGGPFVNEGLELEYEEFDVLECVVQPLTGRAAKDYSSQINPEGDRQYEAFTVYSSTKLYSPDEGTYAMADQIQLPDIRGDLKWFTVLKCDAYVTSGGGRYRFFVVEEPEGEN